MADGEFSQESEPDTRTAHHRNAIPSRGSTYCKQNFSAVIITLTATRVQQPLAWARQDESEGKVPVCVPLSYRSFVPQKMRNPNQDPKVLSLPIPVERGGQYNVLALYGFITSSQLQHALPRPLKLVLRQ